MDKGQNIIGGSAKIVEGKMDKKAVVLLSGGMDSAVCLAYALYNGFEVYPVNFEYGQKHHIEMKRAKEILDYYRKLESFGDDIGPRVLHPLKTLKLNLQQIGGSALTDHSLTMPEGEQKGIPLSYVPGRNVMFLSMALAYAEVNNCMLIFYGANHIDYSGYPDCRPEFVKAMNNIAEVGYKSGAQKTPIIILAPLMEMDKKKIVQKGETLKVPWDKTWSCYDPQYEREEKVFEVEGKGRIIKFSSPRACGKCPACVLRLKGFREACISDPIEYAMDGDGNHCPCCRSPNIKIWKHDDVEGGCNDCGWSI